MEKEIINVVMTEQELVGLVKMAVVKSMEELGITDCLSYHVILRELPDEQ